jgi:serine/threonine protein phosphatase PrpC
MLDLEFVERTDIGRVRDHNEDSMGYASPATPAQVRTHGWMFVLADGVGGQEKGEVALCRNATVGPAGEHVRF